MIFALHDKSILIFVSILSYLMREICSDKFSNGYDTEISSKHQSYILEWEIEFRMRFLRVTAYELVPVQ